MEKITILIADDHVVLREGTRNLLIQEPDLDVVGEASDGEEAVKLAEQLKPNVVLMDVSMPKMDGIVATRLIKAQCPETSILILSAYDDDQFIFKLLQAGAAGYLLKCVHTQELITTIRAVHHGESVLHPSIARKVMNRFLPAGGKPYPRQPNQDISERETEFLGLMARGLSNKEIASELDISIRTVQGNLRQIFKKLGVSSRTEAVVHALKQGWVTLETEPQETR